MPGRSARMRAGCEEGSTLATPLTANRLVEALREEGLRVVEHRRWRIHHRNSKGPWGPVHGVMIHHTVSSGTRRSVERCYNGVSGSAGPLCHGVIAKDGTVYLVGHGRTDHAGRGDADVLRAVAAERPLPPAAGASTDGNRHFYGFECVNLGDGEDPWPTEQLDAVERVAAAVCRALGWTEQSVVGHKEWAADRTDPKGCAMRTLRSGIARRLDGPPDGPPEGPPDGPPSGWPDADRLEPFPGAAFFRPGRTSTVIMAMGRRLVEEGCGHYTVGPGPRWTEADRMSYAAWQRKLGYEGAEADGVPDKRSWTGLRVPDV